MLANAMSKVLGTAAAARAPALAQMEQKTRHGEPQPYPQLRIFLAHQFLRSFCAHAVEFTSILCIAEVSHNTLYFVALAGLLSAAVAALVPRQGKTPPAASDRLAQMVRALGAAAVAVIVFVAVALVLLVTTYVVGASATRLMYVLPLLHAGVSASSASVARAVETDWVPALADGDGAWRARAEKRVTQLALLAGSTAPVVVGLCCSVLPVALVAVVVAVAHTAAMIALLRHYSAVCTQFPALLRCEGAGGGGNGGHVSSVPPPPGQQTSLQALAAVLGERDDDDGDDDSPSKGTAEPVGDADDTTNAAVAWWRRALRDVRARLAAAAHPEAWSLLRVGGCWGAVVASACLSLTVLSLGAVMTVYLRATGVSDASLGWLRGCAAAAGGVGALVCYPYARARLPAHTVGRYALAAQAACAATAAAAVATFGADGSSLVALLVVVSRAGYWCFDAAAQDAVSEVRQAVPYLCDQVLPSLTPPSVPRALSTPPHTTRPCRRPCAPGSTRCGRHSRLRARCSRSSPPLPSPTRPLSPPWRPPAPSPRAAPAWCSPRARPTWRRGSVWCAARCANATPPRRRRRRRGEARLRRVR
jgi:hypothetical protein